MCHAKLWICRECIHYYVFCYSSFGWWLWNPWAQPNPAPSSACRISVSHRPCPGSAVDITCPRLDIFYFILDTSPLFSSLTHHHDIMVHLLLPVSSAMDLSYDSLSSLPSSTESAPLVPLSWFAVVSLLVALWVHSAYQSFTYFLERPTPSQSDHSLCLPRTLSGPYRLSKVICVIHGGPGIKATCGPCSKGRFPGTDSDLMTKSL